MENANAFDILKEEMDSDDNGIKVNTIHKIPIVVTLMAPDAIKNQLIPYLEALAKKEDDEVVFAIAEEFANIGYPLCNYSASTWDLPTILSSCLISRIYVDMMRQ